MSADLEVIPLPPEPPDDDPGPSSTGPTLANLGAERAVLGALLHGDQLDHRGQLEPDDFWRPPHQTIYAAVRELVDRGDPVDAIAIGDHLERTEQLQRVGGFPYLHTLMEAAPPGRGAANYHAALVASVALRRRLREAGQYLEQLAEHPGGDIPELELLDRARGRLDEVAAATDGHDEHAGRGAWLDDLITERTLAYEQPRPLGVKSGFADLDELLGAGVGLQPGQLVVVGARTGVGKSLVVGNLATNAAKAGWGVGMFSLEMTREEVTDRVLAAASSVSLDRLIAHQLTDWDWTRIRDTRERLRGIPLYVDDRPGVTINTIRGKCRDLTRSRHRLGLVVVDYLQLIRAADQRLDRRVQVDALSRELKLLAKEFRVPVVAAAQLNRNTEQRADKTPVLSDLRESGSLEQDADIVILGHKPDEDGRLDLVLAKNRGGSAGRIVSIAWSPSLARLSDLNPRRDEPPPHDGEPPDDDY